MKKIIAITFLLTLVAIACCPSNAQTPQRVGDPATYLTADQLAKYQADIKIAELEKKLDTYGKWVGVGGEIGTAVREGLDAVVDVADKFGKTDVGKFTIVMIAWKVMGKDVLRIIFGAVLFIAITVLTVKIYKNMYYPRRTLTEYTNPGFMKYPKIKKYEVTEPNDDWDGYNFVKVLFIFIYLGLSGITFAIMFA